MPDLSLAALDILDSLQGVEGYRTLAWAVAETGREPYEAAAALTELTQAGRVTVRLTGASPAWRARASPREVAPMAARPGPEAGSSPEADVLDSLRSARGGQSVRWLAIETGRPRREVAETLARLLHDGRVTYLEGRQSWRLPVRPPTHTHDRLARLATLLSEMTACTRVELQAVMGGSSSSMQALLGRGGHAYRTHGRTVWWYDPTQTTPDEVASYVAARADGVPRVR